MMKQPIQFGIFNTVMLNKNFKFMYDKTDKRRLYWLIDQYLSEKIDETTFCNEFHDSFVNEMNYDTLTSFEFDIFRDLSDVSQRFSQYEEDFKLWSGFVSAQQLKDKTLETKEILKKRWSKMTNEAAHGVWNTL